MMKQRLTKMGPLKNNKTNPFRAEGAQEKRWQAVGRI